jgi:hypothetical protein
MATGCEPTRSIPALASEPIPDASLAVVKLLSEEVLLAVSRRSCRPSGTADHAGRMNWP